MPIRTCPALFSSLIPALNGMFFELSVRLFSMFTL